MVENHYPREDELTDLQKQKIAEVRKKCEDVSWRFSRIFFPENT